MFGRANGDDGLPFVDLDETRRSGMARLVADDHVRALERLRAGDGRPITLRELEAAGVGNPASVLYELELAGVPIERVHAAATQPGRVAGFRLGRDTRVSSPERRRRRWALRPRA